MNNEPVAWTEEEIKKACRHVGLTEHMILRIKAYLPVHTHPAKTLTDEEITDIASTLLIATDAIEYEWGVCVTEFARAILRKAQEK